MSDQEKQMTDIAATSNRDIALRGHSNPLISRGIADLTALVSHAGNMDELDSQVARSLLMGLVHTAAQRLFDTERRGPIAEEIAEESGLSFDQIIRVHREFFADPANSRCEQEFKKALYRNSYREREIIKLRYGFDDGYYYTYEEIAHIFKESPEAIHQHERNAAASILTYFQDKAIIRAFLGETE